MLLTAAVLGSLIGVPVAIALLLLSLAWSLRRLERTTVLGAAPV